MTGDDSTGARSSTGPAFGPVPSGAPARSNPAPHSSTVPRHMEHQPDVDLVVQAQAGDQDAFAGLYDRYSPRIYDLCVHMLRDPDDAADATADVFLSATEHIDQLVDPAKIKSWLYAIARNEVYRRSRLRSREVTLDQAALDAIDRGGIELDDGPSMTTTDDHDLAIALPAMSAALVRDAALGLADRDRLVLEMTLAGGLDGRALGDALGMSVDSAHQASHRMRERLARSVGALLVARKGRADCPGLQVVLADWDGAFSVLWRKRVGRHADACAVCGARRQSIPQKVLTGAFAAVPFTFLVPPSSLSVRVLDAAGLRADDPGAPHHHRWRRRDGFPHPPDWSRRRAVAAVAVTVAVIALILGVVAVTAADPEPSVATRLSDASTSSTSSTSSDPGITPDDNTDSTTRPGNTAREAPSTTPTTARTTAPATEKPGQSAVAPSTSSAPTTAPKQPVVVPPTAPAGDTSGPALSVSLPGSVNSSTSAGCSATPISANASDPSGVSQVRMQYSGPTGGTLAMSPAGGGSWTVSWKPPDGSYSVTFTAIDGLGNQTSVARSTTAVQCIG